MAGTLLEDLYAQHRAGEQMLEKLRAALVELAAPRGDPEARRLLPALATVEELIQTEVRHHFREEEEALFPVLKRHLGADAGGPIATMLEEHETFWRWAARLSEGVAALRAGRWDEAMASRVREAGQAILDLLPAHIEKEDNMLFPMAKDVMSATEWEEAERARPVG